MKTLRFIALRKRKLFVPDGHRSFARRRDHSIEKPIHVTPASAPLPVNTRSGGSGTPRGAELRHEADGNSHAK
jgi:hypothetical protein